MILLLLLLLLLLSLLVTADVPPPQMAEGWAKHLAKDDLDIQSSGLEGSRVHPTAKV